MVYAKLIARGLAAFLFLSLFSWIPLGMPCGHAWQHADPSPPRSFSQIASDGTRFVAIGGYNEVLTSPDGILWTHQTHPPAQATSTRSHGATAAS